MKILQKRPRPRWILLMSGAAAAILAAIPLSNASAASKITLQVNYPAGTNCLSLMQLNFKPVDPSKGLPEVVDSKSSKVDPVGGFFTFEQAVSPGQFLTIDAISDPGFCDNSEGSNSGETLGEVSYTVPEQVPANETLTITDQRDGVTAEDGAPAENGAPAE